MFDYLVNGNEHSSERELVHTLPDNEYHDFINLNV